MATLLAKLFGLKEQELAGPMTAQHGLRKRIDTKTPIEEVEFTAFDTELTGLDVKHDSIISIGAVKLKGSLVLPGKTFYRLVKPECELTCSSVVIHELTHTDLEDAEDLCNALNEFVEFIGDSVLIGHFVYIDTGFVSGAMKRKYGLQLQNPSVDTRSLHDWLMDNDPDFQRHFHGATLKTDLFSMAKKYGIALEKAHNAFYDAYVTAQLFQRFAHFLPGAGIHTLGELLSVGKP